MTTADCDMPSPAPSPSRDAARLVKARTEGYRDAIDDALRAVMQRSDADRCPCKGCTATREAFGRVRSLKGQPPPAAPADQSKETAHDP